MTEYVKRNAYPIPVGNDRQEYNEKTVKERRWGYKKRRKTMKCQIRLQHRIAATIATFNNDMGFLLKAGLVR